MNLKEEYQNVTVSIKVKNRNVTLDTSLLSNEDKLRLSKNESFAFLFQKQKPIKKEPIKKEQEVELYPEFTKSKLKGMSLHELKTIYPFTFEKTKGKLIEEIISLNYGNPVTEKDEEEEGIL